jgi:ADP-ribose pyrophosphatase YjhB (NUDIX family)
MEINSMVFHMTKNLEKNILELFTYNYKLKFNQIEKLINERSNKISYHLKNLIKKNILIKEKEFYKLSENSEFLIPYLSEKNSVLSVLLIHLGNKKECFLHERKKRPFKSMLSLPGGRILTGESLKDSVKRLMKEKHDIDAQLKKINSVSIEHLKKKNKILYSYILIFVSAKTNAKTKLTNIEKNKKRIITSDYFLLKNDLDKKTYIKTIYTTKI